MAARCALFECGRLPQPSAGGGVSGSSSTMRASSRCFGRQSLQDLASKSRQQQPQVRRQAAPPRQAAADAAEAFTEEILGWNWTGEDEFTPLGDRLDAPPLPLPRLRHSKRIVLVRHGQSTWNARNRIQGSSNFSVLTDTGMEQARAAHALLADWDFQCLFVSPLKRTVETADLVWGERRKGPIIQLPSLREIDLYSFQGLDKLESRSLFPDQYVCWQNTPADFQLDGHAPVQELWYRASLAWRHILYDRQLRNCGLVVAHNAVNQALLCTALGLNPTFFRRFAQSNAAFTVLDFEYGPEGEGPPRVQVERMNQWPDRPLNPNKLGRSSPNRLVLITGDVTEPAVQASLSMLSSNGVSTPPLIGLGSAAQQALDIRMALEAALSTAGDGRTVVAVAGAAACQQLLQACLGPVDPPAPTERQQQAQQQKAEGQQQQQQQQQGQQQGAASVGAAFGMSPGGITIISWPVGMRDMERGTILCTNYQLPAAAAAPAAEAPAAQ